MQGKGTYIGFQKMFLGPQVTQCPPKSGMDPESHKLEHCKCPPGVHGSAGQRCVFLVFSLETWLSQLPVFSIGSPSPAAPSLHPRGFAGYGRWEGLLGKGTPRPLYPEQHLKKVPFRLAPCGGSTLGGGREMGWMLPHLQGSCWRGPSWDGGDT